MASNIGLGRGPNDAVLGHYTLQGSAWQPALQESSTLFKAIVSDTAGPIEQLIEKEPTKLNVFRLVLYWDSSALATGEENKAEEPNTAVNVKHRTLLMLAAFHGSLRVLSCLLSQGADPKVATPDGLTVYDFANMSASPNKATVLGMLRDAEPLTDNNNWLTSSDAVVPPPTSAQTAATPAGLSLSTHQDGGADPFGPDAAACNLRELTRPEYSTDTFRMFCFKVLRCSKRYAHDWRACPFAHPTENARRRDPREFKYCSVACPDYKQGLCIRGDGCPYAHGIFECWLHPSRYRTQLCKDGARCRRPVCFFAHSVEDLRQPTHQFTPTAEDLMRVATWVVVPGAQPAPGGAAPMVSAPPGLSPAPAAAAMQVVEPAVDVAMPVAGVQVVQPMAQVVPQQPAQQMLMMPQGGMQPRGGAVLAGAPAAAPLPAPRMSNAFARRHGLNPKDNAVFNLQKIAMQNQYAAATVVQPTMVSPMDAALLQRSAQGAMLPPRMQHAAPQLMQYQAAAQAQQLQYQQFLQYQAQQQQHAAAAAAAQPDIVDLATLQKQLSALTFDAHGGAMGHQAHMHGGYHGAHLQQMHGGASGLEGYDFM